MPKTASERLRETRETLGLNQEQFGRLIGKTTGTIYNWENSNPNLNADIRAKLKRLRINPDYIPYGRGGILDGVDPVVARKAVESELMLINNVEVSA